MIKPALKLIVRCMFTPPPASGYFRLEGTGSQWPETVVKVVSNALEAEHEYHLLRRQCGKFGTVEVFDRNGRPVSIPVLQTLAIAEEANRLSTWNKRQSEKPPGESA